jgi:diguanylate cyclase (GGDEF)-like protein/PAS domain S-box-containing protein
MIVAATLLTFTATRYPLLFVIAPFLLLAGVRLGLVGSSIGLIIVSILGGLFTSLGRGPMNFIPHASTAEHIVMFQFFIAFSMLMLYGTEVVTHMNDALQDAVAVSEARFRLLTETSRDVILLSDRAGQHIYVSPAVTEMLGWLPDRLISKTYDDIVHPDDQEMVARLLDNCRTGGSKAAVYRCRKLDGSYLWVETTIRLYSDPVSGQSIGLVSVMRDVSGRKAAEEELRAAYKKVEALATVDGLTGVANRRRLDEILAKEWRRASRDRSCISLLMFDVDHFKAYNDIYGHQGGDDCLRQIAQAAMEVVRRPGDLMARYGGEEFAVILPNTDARGCYEIAEEIRVSIAQRGLPHRGNLHEIVTVSVGCATIIPVSTTGSAGIIEAADKALYRAKKAGRNQVQSARVKGEEEAGSDPSVAVMEPYDSMTA